jgi:hypothetical protein
MASMSGMPELKWAVVNHPIGSVSDDELTSRAHAAVDQVRAIVLSRSDASATPSSPPTAAAPPPTAPASPVQANGFEEANEIFHQRGWTDGLPIIPPTERRVAEFVERVGRHGDDEIGFYELRNRPLTVQKVATNAVMAGCLPEHLPVVIAIVEALLDPAVSFSLHVANASTGSVALGFVVNGPVRNALGMNSHGNVLGPGNRANAAIGRAIRLIQINLMGSIPGAGATLAHDLPILDRSAMGQPSKYTGYHVVENEEAFPSLTPLHVQLGCEPTDSAVTVLALGGHVMLSNHAEKTPDAWIDSLAHYLVGSGRLVAEGYGLLLVPPEAAAMFVEGGWSKSDISRALFERTRRSVAWVKSNGWKIGGRNERGGPLLPGDGDAMLAITGTPEELHVVVCGGPAGNFPFYMYTYGGNCQVAIRKIHG